MSTSAEQTLRPINDGPREPREPRVPPRNPPPRPKPPVIRIPISEAAAVAAINAKHARATWLGAATNNPTRTPNRRGWYQHFKNGSIYYANLKGAKSGKVEAFEVHGEIRAKWAAMGWENSLLGFPTTDEMVTPDGRGRYNHFQGGSIYWTPEHGAFEIHGAIEAKWASLGWERSFLGYPISDELSGAKGIRYSNFERGQIGWSQERGAGVSATTYQPGSSVGGSRPLGLPQQTGRPEVRRVVTCDAHMHVFDDDFEVIGESNDEAHADLSSDRVLITNDNLSELIVMQAVADDEVRVELKVDAMALDTGDIRLQGSLLLYEGDSADNDDLDGELPINFLVARDSIVSRNLTVRNTHEGGDWGKVTLTISNQPG